MASHQMGTEKKKWKCQMSGNEVYIYFSISLDT